MHTDKDAAEVRGHWSSWSSGGYEAPGAGALN